tara:strand:- start:488 stop:646 length:159 start_codon:yes stop_codon:yes gene_type:complete
MMGKLILNLFKGWIFGCLFVAIFWPDESGIAGSFGYNLGSSFRFVLTLIGVM